MTGAEVMIHEHDVTVGKETVVDEADVVTIMLGAVLAVDDDVITEEGADTSIIDDDES